MGRGLRWRSGLGASVLLVACSADTATEAQTKASVMVYADALGLEVTNLLTLLDTAALSAASVPGGPGARGLSVTTCPEGTASGCTTWCAKSTEITRICELPAASARSCETTHYKVSGIKFSLKSDLSSLTRESTGYKGLVKMTYDFSGAYTGPADTSSQRVRCRAEVEVGLTRGQIVTRNVDCQTFDCSIGGATVTCNDFQTELDAQTCGLNRSGGDGGGETPTAVGSCTQPSSSRCQDFTGTLWTAALVQSHCSSASGTYAATVCPTDSRVGSCTISSGSPDEITLRFFAPDDATTAQTVCTTQSGVWTPN